MFSKTIRVHDLNFVKLSAVLEAFKIFVSNKWQSFHSLIIENDFADAVKWVSNPASAPWKYKKWILTIEFLKRKTKLEDYSHIEECYWGW
ncbi:hypothetical protein QUC31_006293 [Theobroma cacao]